MLRAVVRATVAVVSGALVGGLLLMLVYPSTSVVALEMDRDLPPFLTGTYTVEHTPEMAFVWTSSRVVLRLAGLDRRVPWSCQMRVRGAREAGIAQPTLAWSFDGMGGRTVQLGNDFQEITLDVPVRPDRAGLTLTADVAPTFVPGGADTRQLGAQLDWIRCTPDGRVRPPAAALQAAAVGTAALSLAGVVVAAPAVLASGVVVVVGLGLALLLSINGGAFGDYPSLLTTLAIGSGVAIGLVSWAPMLFRRSRVSGAALVAVAASATLALLKLGALEHPGKALIDAIFHAHRLEWVMSGRYFFTQPLPDGVQFPYAIGLYVTAAPLANLVTDHVLLLRLVVILVEAIGGALLFAVVARAFSDRLAGVLAVVLFHLVPLPYVVIGNANLTNAFAQAVALTALCGLALMPFPFRRVRSDWIAAAGVCVLTALAFLSHISTIVLLAGILATATVLFTLARRPDGHRRFAVFVVLMSLLAGVVAIGLYYRHFSDVFVNAFERVLAPAAAVVPVEPADAPVVLSRQLLWHERASASALQTLADIGWPILLLAIAGGLWRLRPAHGRIHLLMTAWVLAWAVFLVGGTFTRVDTQFQRYAAEFVARVNLAGYPVLVMLAALGATAAWRRGRVAGMAALVCLAAAMMLGTSAWFGWFR